MKNYYLLSKSSKFIDTVEPFFSHSKDFVVNSLSKKLTSKVVYLWKFGFFHCNPDCPKQPRIEYPFYRFLYPKISGTISLLWTLGCFIYILDSSKKSITFWTSRFGSSSRSNWTGIWTGNSNGSWTDKQSSHFNTAKEMTVNAKGWCN